MNPSLRFIRLLFPTPGRLLLLLLLTGGDLAHATRALIIAQPVTNNVLRFDGITGAAKGAFIAAGAGGLVSPAQMILGPDGKLYIADSTANVVKRFDLDGNFIDNFTEAGALTNPVSLKFGPDGKLYVMGGGSTRQIHRFNGTNGAFEILVVSSIASRMNNQRDFIFMPSTNDFLIVNSGLNNISRFGFSTGTFVSYYINPTQNIGILNSPTSIIIGPDGNYWVASGNGTNKITRFDITTGARINDPFLGVSATAGHHEQQYESNSGLLFVANGSGNNVVAYDASAYEPSAFTVAKHATDQSGPIAPSEIGNSNVQASFSFGDGNEFVAAGSQGLTNPKNMLFIDINDPPAMNAGADQSAAPGQVVTLNGAGSSDPEGLPLTWQWTQLSGTPVLPGSGVVTGGATSSSVGFIAPNAGGPLVFQLTVSDGVKSATDTVSIALSGTPVASAPVLTLQAADGLTIQGATLRGTVNPLAGTAACRFEYGLTTSYGGQTAIQAITGQQPVSATLTGLAPGQTYHYRLTATNAAGTQFTADGTFSTYFEQREIVVESPPDGGVTDGSGEIDLGKVIFGRSGIARLITIRNAGATDLQLGPITKNGAEPDDFAVSTPAGSLLPAGASESFTVIFTPGALGVRSASIHLVNNDGDEDPFDIALTGTGVTPPEAWRFQYFQTLPDTGAAADSADPDQDGLANLLERAFNLPPTQPAVPILTADTGTTGQPLIRRTGQPPVFSIQYLRRKAAANSGLTYTPQFSSTLDGSGDWSTATGTETVQSIDSEWERVTIEENASGKEKRFGRVKVMSGE